MVEKVLLAYSGGLDTSCILKWLLEKGYDVVCFMADVGQNENFDEAKEKALQIGASNVIIKDLKHEFVENYIWPSIQMGLIYEERYLLGTSLARPCITAGLIETAKDIGATLISHGATGKGNDQVRFEICAMALYPAVKIIAPWRDNEFLQQFQGRLDLLKYAEKHGITVSATPKSPWSMDANIMHISYESGILEDPSIPAPLTLYQLTRDPFKAPNTVYELTIHFENGLPIQIDDIQMNTIYQKPLEILKFLNGIGGAYGIGRIDIVENRFVGLKSRGVYETPGCQILFKAHQDLEVYCLDREIYRLRSYLRDRMSDYVYNGFWFSPESNYLSKCLRIAEENVTGQVRMAIMPGYVQAIARNTKTKGLYNQELVSMDVHGNYQPADATGFIAINAIRIKEYFQAFGN